MPIYRFVRWSPSSSSTSSSIKLAWAHIVCNPNYRRVRWPIQSATSTCGERTPRCKTALVRLYRKHVCMCACVSVCVCVCVSAARSHTLAGAFWGALWRWRIYLEIKLNAGAAVSSSQWMLSSLAHRTTCTRAHIYAHTGTSAHTCTIDPPAHVWRSCRSVVCNRAVCRRACERIWQSSGKPFDPFSSRIGLVNTHTII